MKRLILFDIDGTLLSARGAAKRAFHRAMVEVYGTAGPIATHSFAGKTDPQIARELLTLHGLSDAATDAGLPALWAAYLRELEAELAHPDHATDVLPGVMALLEALDAAVGDAVVGLLTGNIEAGARLKLRSAGLPEFRLGAYGSDCERRDGLPPIAVGRARALTGREFRGRDIRIVGDTPADVSCGAALDVHTVAVATGGFDEAALAAAGAHTVFPDLADTGAVLEALLS
jgi:phosphoglycolate phosphatase-like HAD superfamily hydrolase